MQHLTLRPVLLLFSIFISITACSKKTDDPPAPDRTESMKNTVWSGEYQYTAGDLVSPQPFSVSLAADGTLTWHDIESSRPGGTWLMKQDTIRITFPNNTGFSATVGIDSWSSFKADASAGVLVSSVIAAKPSESLSLGNTNWTGTHYGSKLDITLFTDLKMTYKLGGGDVINTTYTMEGAGIRFTYTGITSQVSNYANITSNGTVMKAIEKRISGFPYKTTYMSYATTKL
ncbi:MAG: hypothetical protein ABW174_11790 [Flavitalea sp.]